jgi:hypothetical protein
MLPVTPPLDRGMTIELGTIAIAGHGYSQRSVSLPTVYPIPFLPDNSIFNNIEMIISGGRHAGVNW